MKLQLFTLLLLFSVLISAQTLTPKGIEPVTEYVDFSKTEILNKIMTFANDFLANDKIELIPSEDLETLTLKGIETHKACFIEHNLGRKTCFELHYTLKVTAIDQGYIFDVAELKAVNKDRYPNANYDAWFDESGNAVPSVKACVDATNEYFRAFNSDFKEYIETGEYW